MSRSLSGFREISHTADWALEVWAPDLAELFAGAARGMFSLMEIQVDPGFPIQRELEVRADDAESLLVSFLTEALYLSETEGAGFTHFEVRVDGWEVDAILSGSKLTHQRKEIKAVTYHNLHIDTTEQGMRVVIVFDV